MDNISLNTANTNNINNAEVKKRLESQENFEALDKEKLKQDSIELATKATEEVKGNWITKTLKNTILKDPKKMFTSLGLTLLTVVGLAFLGNKSVNAMGKLGLNVDEILKNNKIYTGIAGFFKNCKDKIFGFLKKSKTISNISDTLENKFAKPVADLVRGYGRGFVSIFSLTPVDTLQKAFKDVPEAEMEKGIKALVGNVKLSDLPGKIDGKELSTMSESASEYITRALKTNIKDNREFCSLLSNAIRKNFNCQDNKKFNEILLQLKNGKITQTGSSDLDLSQFINVDMKGGGPFGSWWPVNIIDKIGKKIRGNKWKPFGKGNLGDSLLKFNIVNGTMADTKIGSLVQKSILIPTESISNFVNDKSGLGVFLCSTIMSLYNNVQDAPKEKKVATIADDYIGTIGSIAISTPLAFKTTYALASLAGLEKGKGILSAPLRGIGKFFSIGLNKPDLTNAGFFKKAASKIAGIGGGSLRFITIMFILSPLFQKPIRALIHKIFGKPYDKAEEEKKAELEKQKNTVIQELGITQGELMERVQKNPQALAKVQNDPELANLIGNNPKLILDLLDGKDIKQEAKKALANAPMSPINTNFINRAKTQNLNKIPETVSTAALSNSNTINTNKADLFSSKQETSSNPYQSVDTATYIPSSEFVAKQSTISQEQNQEYTDAMNKADEALKNAERFI